MPSATSTISDKLLERIEAKEWGHGEQLPSRNQLCQEYGVSPATVSNAIKSLADKNLVRSEPGRGVFVVTPDRDIAGRAVDSESVNTAGTDRVIALVGSYVPPSSDFQKEGMSAATRDSVMDGIWSAAQQSGDHLLLLSQSREDFDIELIKKQNFDGMILLGGLPLETLVKVRQSGIPAIHANASIIGGPVNFIDYDNAGMIRQMVKIFAKNGHEKISCVMHDTSVPEFLPWLRGNFHAALEESGISHENCNWLEIGTQATRDETEALEAINKLLDSNNPPTALYCHGPVTAGAAEKVLARKGLSAPEDISVIGSFNYSSQVNFSGFTIPNFELAKQLTDSLSLIIDNPNYFVQKLLPIPYEDNGTVARAQNMVARASKPANIGGTGVSPVVPAHQETNQTYNKPGRSFHCQVNLISK